MKYIAVDFDGTCVYNKYTEIGENNPGAIETLQKLAKKNKIILLTMRSGVLLSAAKQWFSDNNIPLYSVNSNPSQTSWSKSNKIFANFYIDDNNLGCPYFIKDGKRAVDWSVISTHIKKEGLI